MKLAVIPIGLTAVIGLYLIATGVDFALDDAWIHLAYAKSLKLGDGLSYNPNDRETGASSPLWVMILAAIPWFGKPMWASKLLGLMCQLGAVGVLMSLLKQWFPMLGAMTLICLGLCAGLAPLAVQASVSGMAVSLTSFLWLGAIWGLNNKRKWALVLVFLSVAARSELVVFWGVWGVLSAWNARQLKPLNTALAAGVSLLLWMGYCHLVSGFWFPNTKYVKALDQGFESLFYLPMRYVWEEPILWSVLGACCVVVGLWKNKNPVLTVLGVSWFFWVLATVFTRSLDPSVLFFQSRYFAPLSATLVMLLASGLSHLHKPHWWVLPILAATVGQLPSRLSLIADQESDILSLHTQPARQMVESLPPESVVLVEGAGASRFWLPRDMWVLDVIGLNHQPIAHMTSFSQLRCYLATQPIDFAVLPRHMVNQYMTVYALEELMVFDEAQYHQTEPPFSHSVYIFRSHGIRPEIAEVCAAP